MGYYNSRLALWEPLIEPVEILSEGVNKQVPWELKLEVSSIIFRNISQKSTCSFCENFIIFVYVKIHTLKESRNILWKP